MIAAYFLMAIAVAALFSKALRGIAPSYILWMTGIVIGYTALLLPLQIVAALQLAGFVSGMPQSAWLAIEAALLTAAFLIYFRSKPVDATEPLDPLLPARPLHLKLGIAVMAATLLAFVLRAFFAFPQGYDAIAYHYAVALRWLQDGSLQLTRQTIWNFGLPGNGELLMMLTLATHHDRWLIWVSWPSVAVMILSFRYFCTQIFALRESFVPVSLTALSIPMVCYQAFSGYVDVMGTALLFTAVALAMFFAESASAGKQRTIIWLLFVAGLSCGIATGTKPTFWPLIALLFIAVVIGLARKLSWRHKLLFPGLLLFVAGIIVPSIFWFARAFLETGNPLYPMQVTVLGHTFPGFVTTGNAGIAPAEYQFEFVKRPIEWLIYPWTEWKRHPGYLLQSYSEVTGLGGMFTTFAIPGVLFAAWLSIRRNGKYKRWALLLGLLALLLLSWWFLYDKNLRYVLALPLLACLLSAPFFEAMERLRTRTYPLLFVTALIATCAILAFEPIHAIASTLRSRNWSRAFYYGYPEALDRLPPGSVLLNLAGAAFDFPLAGANLSNRVISPLEVPGPLTPEFVQQHQIEYIVQEFDNKSGAELHSSAPPILGLGLVYSKETKLESGVVTRWRLWRVR